jgi:hypothetical protein
MIQDLDNVLQQVLIREIPIKNGEVDIAFDQPTREWAARLSRPTLNVFLHDIRENLKLRHSQQWVVEQNPDGTATQRRTPVRVDLHFMITAWANEPEDEHNLLAGTLMALFRQPHLPQDLLPESLQEQPRPIPLQVAQTDELRNPADVWSALDNEIRPSVVLTVTLAIDPYQEMTTPLVRTREIRFGQSADPLADQSLEEGTEDIFWSFGGTIHTDQALADLKLRLVERGLDIPVKEDGQFAVSGLRAGDYTLEVTTNGRKLKTSKVSVPGPDYELEV